MPNKISVAVIIPNWNGEDYIRECLYSLLRQSETCDIIVVENGSTDGSDKILAGYGRRITVLKQPKNLGFAGGVNKGIKYSLKNNYDFIGLFNNDAIADKDWLKNLLNSFDDDNKIGGVTCKFLHIGDNKLDSTGDLYTIYGMPYPRGRNELDKKQYDALNDVFSVSGGATIFKAEMFKDIGLFDEDFFAYYEDVDLGFRAQLKGWKLHYEPTAKAYHHISATGGKIKGFGTYQTAKNFWIIYIKNMPGWLFVKYLPLSTYWYTRILAARLVKGGFVPFVKGWFKGLLLIPSSIRKRRYIQKNRTVSSSYIDSILVHSPPPKPPR